MARYSGKRAKDVNKPKRPQSAYFLFLADFRAKQKANFQHEGGHKDLIRAGTYPEYSMNCYCHVMFSNVIGCF